MDNVKPLTVLEYGHKVKIGICLKMIGMAKSEKAREYWQNTLDIWDARARAASFADAAAWVKAS